MQYTNRRKKHIDENQLKTRKQRQAEEARDVAEKRYMLAHRGFIENEAKRYQY